MQGIIHLQMKFPIPFAVKCGGFFYDQRKPTKLLQFGKSKTHPYVCGVGKPIANFPRYAIGIPRNSQKVCIFRTEGKTKKWVRQLQLLMSLTRVDIATEAGWSQRFKGTNEGIERNDFQKKRFDVRDEPNPSRLSEDFATVRDGWSHKRFKYRGQHLKQIQDGRKKDIVGNPMGTVRLSRYTQGRRSKVAEAFGADAAVYRWRWELIFSWTVQG